MENELNRTWRVQTLSATGILSNFCIFILRGTTIKFCEVSAKKRTLNHVIKATSAPSRATRPIAGAAARPPTCRTSLAPPIGNQRPVWLLLLWKVRAGAETDLPFQPCSSSSPASNGPPRRRKRTRDRTSEKHRGLESIDATGCLRRQSESRRILRLFHLSLSSNLRYLSVDVVW